MQKTIDPNIKIKIIDDLKSGKTLNLLSKKYDLSLYQIRKIKKENIGRTNRITTKERGKAERLQKSRIKRELLLKQKIETEVFKEIVREGFIDVFEGIRQSIMDMLELNEEMKKIPEEIAKQLNELLSIVKKRTKINDPIRQDIYKTIGYISSFWGRGKLRIESRKELGQWFDRYNKLQLTIKQFNYYQNVITAIFEGLNLLDGAAYNLVKDTACNIFPLVNDFFEQNEEQTWQTSYNQLSADFLESKNNE